MSSCSVLKPGWSPATIGLMVLGFIVFWPLGLAMLAYILWGHRFSDMAQDAKDQWRASPLNRAMNGSSSMERTGNVAFDEYRAKELKRLEEEKAKLDAMRSEFDSFLRDLHRARDQEEFDRFMSKHGRGAPSTGDSV